MDILDLDSGLDLVTWLERLSPENKDAFSDALPSATNQTQEVAIKEPEKPAEPSASAAAWNLGFDIPNWLDSIIEEKTNEDNSMAVTDPLAPILIEKNETEKEVEMEVLEQRSDGPLTKQINDDWQASSTPTQTRHNSTCLLHQQEREEQQEEQPQYKPLIEYLLNHYRCTLKELQVHLTCTIMRRRILSQLRRLRIETTHLRPKSRNFRVHAHDISIQNANYLTAFNGKLGITVRQYYFTKHAKNLLHHYMPCLIEHGGGKHKSYYPFEVLTVKLA